ncbi:MAG TPA: taurine dioxygenase [Candidatus Baltobacteraceae bacterium]|jgi:taurine dioxygenase|nr:taurine dioxygenase [Candidatus Baltobacteraceae bacterium]
MTAPSSTLRIRRLTPALGASIENFDLGAPLSDGDIAMIEEALSQYLVLFFDDQSLSAVQQRDFAARFGKLYRHPFYPGEPDAPEIMILAHDATRRASSDRWHNDVTYLEAPPKAGVLYAEEIPEVGGDTLWANMYLAFETLAAPVKEFVSGLRAVHSFAKNFTAERFRDLGMESQRERVYAAHPPVSHPVARTNPKTGRKALFVNQDFTTHIEGLSSRESDTLLHFLFEHMAQPEFQVRWRWQPRTVAFWDNCWTQHYALADYFPEKRRVRRATILGDRPS